MGGSTGDAGAATPSILTGPLAVPPEAMTAAAAAANSSVVMDALEGIRQDGWYSALTGLGTDQYDKRLSHSHSWTALTYEEIATLWETDDIAAKAIEAPAAECFREGYDITIADEGKYDDLKESLEQKLLDLNADAAIERAYQFRRAYGGSAILIGANDGGALYEPLNPSKVTSIDYLNVFEPLELQPAAFYSNPLHPKYGLPEFFQLNNLRTIGPILPVPGLTDPLAPEQILYIHESRLIVFQGIRTSRYFFSLSRHPVNDYWGASIMPRFYETLRDFGVGFAGAGLLATDMSQPVIAINGLRDMVAKNQAALRLRMQALNLGRSTARAILIDAEKEKFERQSTALSGIPELLDRLSQRLAASVDIPLSILVGYSPASLGQPDNAELIQWYNRVRSIQRRELSPVLRRLISLLMRTMRQRGLPKKWDIDWCELEHLTILQQAEARLTQARTDSLNIKSGMLYPDEPRQSRFKGKYSFDTQINESKKAPGFMAPLPAGVMPGATPAIGVVNALEAKAIAGGAGAGGANGPTPANANAHNVTGYTRRNPTAPALGANPPVGGDKAPGDRGDEARGDAIATFEDLVQAAQAGQVMRTFAGLPIVIENPKGSTRNWVDSDGTTGSTKMRYDYGYIDGTCGPDGDGVDVYLGPNPDAHWVYVVHQMSKASGFQKFDEDKAMLGFDSANHARDAYLGQYNDERFFGGMTQMTVDDFKRQLITATAGRIQHAQMDGLEDEVDEYLAKRAAEKRARRAAPAAVTASTAGATSTGPAASNPS